MSLVARTETSIVCFPTSESLGRVSFFGRHGARASRLSKANFFGVSIFCACASSRPLHILDTTHVH